MKTKRKQNRIYSILFWGSILLLVLTAALLYWRMDVSAHEEELAKENITKAKQQRDEQERTISQLKSTIQDLNFTKELSASDRTDQELLDLIDGVDKMKSANQDLEQQYEDIAKEVEATRKKAEKLADQAEELEQKVQAKRESEEASRRAAEEESRRAEEESRRAQESQNPSIDLNAYYNLNRFADRDYSKVVYLTFDDGPSSMTPKVLDILDRYNIKATFFVTYKTYSGFVPYYKEIVDRGHAIGVHTASHDYDYVYANMDNFANDFNQIYDWIVQQTGVHTTLYRFPGGSKSSHNGLVREDIKAFLAQRGMMYYDWNVANGDGGTVTADEAYHNVIDNIQRVSHPMILMHDTKQTTVDALPRILEKLLEWGYTFEVITPEVKPVWQGVR